MVDYCHHNITIVLILKQNRSIFEPILIKFIAFNEIGTNGLTFMNRANKFFSRRVYVTEKIIIVFDCISMNVVRHGDHQSHTTDRIDSLCTVQFFRKILELFLNLFDRKPIAVQIYLDFIGRKFIDASFALGKETR